MNKPYKLKLLLSLESPEGKIYQQKELAGLPGEQNSHDLTKIFNIEACSLTDLIRIVIINLGILYIRSKYGKDTEPYLKEFEYIRKMIKKEFDIEDKRIA